MGQIWRFFGDSGARKLVLRPRGAETPRVVAQATSIDGDSRLLVILGPIFSGLQVDFGPLSRFGGGSGGVCGADLTPRRPKNRFPATGNRFWAELGKSNFWSILTHFDPLDPLF